ncbi:hypothetical protein L249_7509 [Ophiocordyceps polyrhachis-furcata BCC 54312]|uniref:Uncharacterized protein n=1 Tax=Ophiocordyceps polyrhachis-furcata BCC 54312 TaxID=1330021 RepID=A0A367LAK1_9HYPO|nr:hypothetical protein L249_7509 [Ophiocordyceps polyrhachis-furcata BCC 54312]
MGPDGKRRSQDSLGTAGFPDDHSLFNRSVLVFPVDEATYLVVYKPQQTDMLVTVASDISNAAPQRSFPSSDPASSVAFPSSQLRYLALIMVQVDHWLHKQVGDMRHTAAYGAFKCWQSASWMQKGGKYFQVALYLNTSQKLRVITERMTAEILLFFFSPC